MSSKGSSSVSTARLFVVERTEDLSGTSGTGVIAEGVQYSNGACHLHWMSQLESYELCANIHVVQAIHGHEGRTVIRWL